jgi:hypothetical protein
VSIDESMDEMLGHVLIPQILDAGLNLDFIDGDAIDKLGISYPVLVLPGIDRLPLATYKKIEQYAQHGRIVIATRRLPSTAPGLLNSDNESQQIKGISERLFRETGAKGIFIQDEGQLKAVLRARYKPDVFFSPAVPEIGFIHRKMGDGDLYFIANTANHSVLTTADFRATKHVAEWWDPLTGRISPISRTDRIEISLQPYESRLIVFSDSAAPADSRSIEDHTKPEPHFQDIDLSSEWQLTFTGLNRTVSMAKLHSWSEEKAFAYYSGQVIYSKTIDLAPDVASSKSLILDFGEGTPVPQPDPLPAFNMRAYLDGPVREAAEVFMNDKPAGVVWHPPYLIDVTKWVRPGKNRVKIVVGNTAINSLAGKSLPDYRLLNDRYGQRFVPQGMNDLQPLPSGIVGGLRLHVIAEAR